MVLSKKSFTIWVRFCCNGRILLGLVSWCDQVGGLVMARPHPGLGWRAHQVVEVDHELRAQLAHGEHVQAPADFIGTEHIWIFWFVFRFVSPPPVFFLREKKCFFFKYCFKIGICFGHILFCCVLFSEQSLCFVFFPPGRDSNWDARFTSSSVAHPLLAHYAPPVSARAPRDRTAFCRTQLSPDLCFFTF